jgi:hypothetical protein
MRKKPIEHRVWWTPAGPQRRREFLRARVQWEGLGSESGCEFFEEEFLGHGRGVVVDAREGDTRSFPEQGCAKARFVPAAPCLLRHINARSEGFDRSHGAVYRVRLPLMAT